MYGIDHRIQHERRREELWREKYRRSNGRVYTLCLTGMVCCTGTYLGLGLVSEELVVVTSESPLLNATLVYPPTQKTNYFRPAPATLD